MNSFFLFLIKLVIFKSTYSKFLSKANQINANNKESRWEAFMPPYVNQGDCANCWANSISTLITTKMNILTNSKNNQERISIQQVMDCINDSAAYSQFGIKITSGHVGNGCQALDPNDAGNVISVLDIFLSQRFNFIKYPITPKETWETFGGGVSFNDANCKSTTSAYKSYLDINPNARITAKPLISSSASVVNEMKNTLDRYGPLLINIVTTGSFITDSTTEEVLTCTPGSNYGMHSMILFGYDSEFWYIRNSWNSPLPVKFRIGKNMCRIEELIFYLKDNYSLLKVNYKVDSGKALYISGSESLLGGWTTAYKLTNMSDSEWEFRVLDFNSLNNTEFNLILTEEGANEIIIDLENKDIIWEFPQEGSWNKKIIWNNGMMTHVPIFPK